jgi:RNA polymerase sigma factor (sigma-70 family)
MRTKNEATSDTDGRDDVGVYLYEISRTPLLNAAQEVELAKKIEVGVYADFLLDEGEIPRGVRREELVWLVADGKQAKDQFLRANLRLVVSIARRYLRSGMAFLDLIQEGNIGLIRAVEKFDYERGYKFSTYATWWVRQAITRGIAQKNRAVRLPVHMIEDVNRMLRAREQLRAEMGGDEPTPAQIAEVLGISVAHTAELIGFDQQEPVSLDAEVGEDDSVSLGDLVGDDDAPSPEAIVLAGIERDQIESLLSCLSGREAALMRARYGLSDGRERTLTEVAAEFGLSRERIRQLEIRSLGRLRDLARGRGLQEEGWDADPEAPPATLKITRTSRKHAPKKPGGSRKVTAA